MGGWVGKIGVVRKHDTKPGAHAYLVDRSQYPLPPGLADGQPVQITARIPGDPHRVRVVTEDGEEHALLKWQMDAGTTYRLPGGVEAREYEMRTIEYLLDQLAEAERQIPVHSIWEDTARSYRQMITEAYRWRAWMIQRGLPVDAAAAGRVHS